MKYLALLFPMIIALLACSKGETSVFSAIDDDHKTILQHIRSNPDLFTPDTLINMGLYNLAMEAIHARETSDSSLIVYAGKLGETGEFDKSNALLDRLSGTMAYQDEYYKLKMWFALEKMDTVLSLKYADSLNLFGYISPDDPEDYAERHLLLAVQHHNCKRYPESIRINEQMLSFIQRNKLPERLHLIVYRKLGNNYNDIVREKIPFPLSLEACRELALKYYRLEMDIMERNPEKYKVRMALNHITMAMALNTWITPSELKEYYFEAIKNLLIMDNGDLVLTRNPIYLSICIPQLLYQLKREDLSANWKIIKEYSGIHFRLMNTRALFELISKTSFDIKNYYHQRNPEVLLYFSWEDNFKMTSDLELLKFSNQLKYPNQQLFSRLINTYGEKTPTLVFNYFLLNEIMLFDSYMDDPAAHFDSKQVRLDYNQIFKAIFESTNLNLTQGALDTLMLYCKQTNTTIVDYQHIIKATLITFIKPDTIYRKVLSYNHALPDALAQNFLKAISNQDIEAFKEHALLIYRKLHLAEVNTQNILIIPDEVWSPIPYDALLPEKEVSSSWQDLNYLIKNHQIYTIPNITSVYPLLQERVDMEICLWSSRQNEQTLPYNKSFREYLRDNYDVTDERPSPDGILHILAHSAVDGNRVRFQLDQRSISIEENYDFTSRMVILHGCSSGVGRGLASEGMLSLWRSFLYNGSSAVVYSIWDVDNHSSTNLFKHFYGHAKKDDTMAASLRKAKLSLLNEPLYPEWSSPFYWANFQYIGSELVAD